MKERHLKTLVVATLAAAALIAVGCNKEEPVAEAPKGTPPATSSVTPDQRDARASGRAEGGRGVVNN